MCNDSGHGPVDFRIHGSLSRQDTSCASRLALSSVRRSGDPARRPWTWVAILQNFIFSMNEILPVC